MRVCALIAVRAGSQRVKNKNIKKFADSNLLEIKIQQLKNIDSIDEIYVNSDDDNMLDISKKLGCKVVKRDEYYASSIAPMSEVYKNMAENIDADVIVYANVTNPMIEDGTIKKMINFYIENLDKYDSVNSSSLVKKFLFKNNKPINYDLKHQPRSQDLPEIHSINFAISVISKEKMIEQMNVVGQKPFLYAISESEGIDIDTPLDFEIAEYLYKRKLKNDSTNNI